jgi:Uma2 family endonuclease
MTSLIDWNDPPPDGWTIDDLERLSDGGQRRELIDGVIPVGPEPGPLHEAVARLLAARIQEICPPEYEVSHGVPVRFTRRRCLIPDVEVVFRPGGPRRTSWFAPREVVIAAEIVSPTSLVMDRITKPALYAAAGIPYYWRVETDGGIEVSTYRLDLVDETYRQTGEFRDTIDLVAPWPIKIPVGGITPSSVHQLDGGGQQ